MHNCTSIALLLLAIALASCPADEPPRTRRAASAVTCRPAATSLVRDWHVGDDGTIVLSWMQRDESGAYAALFDNFSIGEWQEADRRRQRPRMFVNWADLPSVTPLNSKPLGRTLVEQERS